MPQVQRSSIFISLVFVCSPDLHTRDAHCWSPAPVRLPSILKPETTDPWMSHSPCLWGPNVKNKYHGQTLSYDSIPSILLSRSSAILWSRGSAIREISFWLISQQRCLAATQPGFQCMMGLLAEGQLSPSNNQGWGYRGDTNKTMSPHPIRNSLPHL